MLDADILYMPGSAEAMKYELEALPQNAYCFGIRNDRWDGTQVEEEAHKSWPGTGNITQKTAIAWTQYGIFKADICRKYKFPEYGVFFGPGYGFEDDWMHAKLEEDGFGAYECDLPLYYHDKHKTMQLLPPEQYEASMAERQQELKRRFPNFVHWSQRG
jgi:hypothetical protein